MNYFLVDYENVNVGGLNGVSNLTENDTVIIFYSVNADTLTFEMHKQINESKATFKFQKILLKEKNALDFQLCSYLGFLIRDTMTDENAANNFFIVSNDKGYSILPDYWKKFGVNLNIVSNLSKNEIYEPKIIQPQISQPKIIQPAKNPTEIETALNKFFNNKNEVAEIINFINNAKTKNEINNFLGKKFATQKGGEIYRAIKPFLADKK